LLRCFQIALLFASLAFPAAAETLVQAVSRAVQYFPEIQAVQSRREASSAQTGQARAELFPSVNVALGEGRETSRNASTRALGGDPTLTRREADLSVSQLLFDGGAAGGQVRRFGARTEGAAFTVLDTFENVGLRTGQAFMEVRRLREQLAVAQENVITHERTLSDVNALADAGRGRRADVVQAEARRALASSALELLAGQLNQAEAAYKYFTGRFPDQLDAPSEFAPVIAPRLDEAVASALRKHPAVRASEKELEAAQHDRESARARMAVPRVTIEAGASRNRDIDGIVGPDRDHYAMLRLRYNLFRGFGDSERVRETQARIDEALANLQRVRNEVERDVRQAWEALASDRIRLPQLAEYARASADVAEAYRLQFQLGQRSLLDVLNAENERFNAVGGYIAGRAAVTVDELRLLASAGRLLEALGIAVPQQQQAETER
jgi:adhesin transport system outer membrane protein